jgi:hypothetical protein
MINATVDEGIGIKKSIKKSEIVLRAFILVLTIIPTAIFTANMREST